MKKKKRKKTPAECAKTGHRFVRGETTLRLEAGEALLWVRPRVNDLVSAEEIFRAARPAFLRIVFAEDREDLFGDA